MSTSGPPALILHGGDETNTIHITFGNRSCGATRPVVQSTRRASLAECGRSHVVRSRGCDVHVSSANADDHTLSGRVGVMFTYPTSTTLVQSARNEGYQ